MEITKIGTETTNNQHDEETQKTIANAQKTIQANTAKAHELVDAISTMGGKYNPMSDTYTAEKMMSIDDAGKIATLTGLIVGALTKIWDLGVKIFDDIADRKPKHTEPSVETNVSYAA